MKKNLLLLTAFVLLITTAHAQNLRHQLQVGPGPVYNNQAFLDQQRAQELKAESVSTPDAPSQPAQNTETPPAGKSSAFKSVPVGSATNAFTIINNRTNQVYSVDRPGKDNDLMGWIHRHSTIRYGGSPETTANGVLRSDLFSPNCAGIGSDPSNVENWRIDVGPFNPLPFGNSSRPRYPQALMHVPTGSGADAKDYRLVWTATCTDGTRWGNLTWGTAKDLCTYGIGASSDTKPPASNSSFSFLNNRQDNLTLIPGGLCEGRNGEFWKLDQAFSGPTGGGGRNLDSLYLFKGTFVPGADSVRWSKHRTFFQNFWRERSGTDNANFNGYAPGGANIAFSPNGQWGWAASIFDNDDPARPNHYDANPHFWYTNDFGATWNGPIVLNIRDFDEIVNTIRYPYARTDGAQQPVVPEVVDTSTGIPFVLGYFDIVVDNSGNPHMIANFANLAGRDPAFNGPAARRGAVPHIDTLRFFNANVMALFDITTYDNGKTWNAVFLHQIFKRLGTVEGTAGFNFDNFTQAARDPLGEYVFASWVDDTARSSGTDNMRPDLFTRAIRLSDMAMTPEGANLSQDDGAFGKRIYFPTMAPVTLSNDVADKEFTLPTVFANIPNGENNQTFFYFIVDRQIKNSDFVLPAIDIEITTVSAPQDRLCFQTQTPVTVTLTNRGTVALMDTFDIAYSINGAAPVVERISLPQAIAPGATYNYTFNRAANIAESGNYVFFIETRLEGDNVFQNNQKTVNVLNFGGADRQIFTSGTLSGCGSLVVNTGLEGFTTAWTLDGNVLPVTGSRITLTKDQLTGETGTLQIAVSNPGCDPASITDQVTVVINDIPTLDLLAEYQKCKTAGDLSISATSTPNANYQYEWRLAGTPAFSQTTNAVTLNQSGRYTATVRNTQTQCDTSATIQVYLWALTVNLGTVAPEVCEPIVLDAENETSGTGVNYKWFVNGLLKADGINGRFSTSVDTLAPNGIGAKTYRVEARDPLGCNDATPATGQKTVTTYSKNFNSETAARDTLEAFFEGNYPVGPQIAQACCCRNIIIVDNSGSGMTGITGKYWYLGNYARINREESLIVGSRKGDDNVSGSDTLVIKLPCDREFGTALFTVNLVVKSGTCRDTVSYLIQSILPGTFRSCPVPNTTDYPNLDAADEGMNTAEGWAKCSGVGRGDKYNAELGLSVYPNPGTGSYNLTMNMTRPDNIELKLYDLNGRVIWDRKEFAEAKHNTEFDLSHLPSGIYLMKVLTPEGYQSIRIVQN